MRFIFRWFTSAVAVFVTLWIVPGIEIHGGMWAGPLVFSLVLAFVNTTIRPVMQIVGLPFTILTLGLGVFVINTIALMLASILSYKIFGMGIMINSFFSAFIASLIISIVTTILRIIFDEL